jgi:Asp-tRNA(Asn)/Glu-tRNA(Gln) amidotransferase A subunit family amidase
MARRAADLSLALRVLAAPDPDTAADAPAPREPDDPTAVAIGQLRVAAYTDDGYFPPAPAIRRAVREAAVALRERGTQVEDFRPPDVAEAARLYFGLYFADGLDEIRQHLGGGPCDWRVRRILLFAGMPTALRSAVGRLLAWMAQRYAAQIVGFVPRRRLTAEAYARLIDEEAAYRGRFLAALDAGQFDAIVCPASGLPALRHGEFNGSVASSYPTCTTCWACLPVWWRRRGCGRERRAIGSGVGTRSSAPRGRSSGAVRDYRSASRWWRAPGAKTWCWR